MKFTETAILGSYLIDLEQRVDERGFFARYFCDKEFSERRLVTRWVQINNSMSLKRGTLRGLHLQIAPRSEAKLVRCIKGAIWDVIVDLRNESDTYGSWVAAELNCENRTMMYVPEGCAHGFVSLSDNSEILYLVSEFYSPECERTLRWDDPDVAIDWPIEPTVISPKDMLGSSFRQLGSDHQLTK